MEAFKKLNRIHIGWLFHLNAPNAPEVAELPWFIYGSSILLGDPCKNLARRAYSKLDNNRKWAGECGQNEVPAFVEKNPIFKVIEELPSAGG